MTEAELLRLVRDILVCEQVPYFLVGSLASSYYGEPRFTLDVDIAIWLAAEVDRVDRICARFPESDFYVSVDAARHAALHGGQFNVLHPASSMKIDFMILENSVYDRHRRGRVRAVQFPETGTVMIAAPEDIVIKKMIYFREGGSEKHLRDIASILRVRRGEIDHDDIASWAKTLGVFEIWQDICKALARYDK